MIPTETEYKVHSTHSGEKSRMGIASDAIEHVMDLLAGVYKDTITALIREYSTNGLDAQREAGVTKPIEISLPSALRPIFEVRDHGVGMSADEVTSLYSMYGASTKRGSNDFTGMMGIGCKAALAYSNQFTVSTVKNGQRTVTLISRDEDGGGSATHLDQSATDEPDGTTVTIPVNSGDSDSFNRKAKEFFQYWERGSVLIDGQEPTPITESAYKLSDDLWIVRDDSADPYGATRGVILMGNVPYPVSFPAVSAARYHSLVARVDLGEVMPTPSREGLKETKQLAALIKRISEDYERARSARLERALASAASKRDAGRVIVEAFDTAGLPADEFNYQGEAVNIREPRSVGAQATMFENSSYRTSGSIAHSTRLIDALQQVWITGYSNKSANAAAMSKIYRWLSAEKAIESKPSQRFSLKVALISSDKPLFDEWIPADQVFDYSEIRAWRDPDAPKSERSQLAGTYNTLYSDGSGITGRNKRMPATDIDSSKPIYYLTGAEQDTDIQKHAMLSDRVGECYLVRLPETRLKKFLGLFPEARDGSEALKDAAGEWWKALSAAERRAVEFWGGGDGSYRNWGGPGRRAYVDYESFNDLDPRSFDDPDLRSVIKWSKAWNQYLRHESRMWKAHLAHKSISKRVSEVSLRELGERYPLFPNSNSMGDRESLISHAEIYANAVWSALKSGE